MKTIVRGAVKGAIIGLIIGICFAIVDTDHHMVGTKFILFGTTGALVGLLCGTPVWKRGAGTSNMLKAGLGIVIGLIAMAAVYYLFDFEVGTRRLSSHYALVAAIFGAVYGSFVEFDDSSDSNG